MSGLTIYTPHNGWGDRGERRPQNAQRARSKSEIKNWRTRPREPESGICAINSDFKGLKEVLDTSKGEYDFFGKKVGSLGEKTRRRKSLHGVVEIETWKADISRNNKSQGMPRILIVDQGGESRARLTASILTYMVNQTGINAFVDIASLGPPTNGGSVLKSVGKFIAQWISSDKEAHEKFHAVPRQFDETQDASKYDAILVMDKYDLKEILQEISYLDFASPGKFYSSRVRLLPQFAILSSQESKMASQDEILDPIFLDNSKPESLSDIRLMAENIATSCRGLFFLIHGLQKRRYHSISPREAFHQVLKCPAIWMEMPYRQDRTGRPRVARKCINGLTAKNRSKWVDKRQKEYWKDVKNIELEIHRWMMENNVEVLPTHAMLKNSGALDLATAIDFHGGLTSIAMRMNIQTKKRKPNGFWNDLSVLCEELRSFSNRMGSQGIMPTAKELVTSGRTDLVKAIRQHGGFHAVASNAGLKPHRVNLWKESDIVSILKNMQEAKIPITRSHIRMKGIPGLEAAVDRFGGFPYFVALLSGENEHCFVMLDHSFRDDNGSMFDCPVPYIERVAMCMEEWMSARPAMKRLPTKQELDCAGSSDIWKSIQRAGGVQKLSLYMGIPYKETRGKSKERPTNQECAYLHNKCSQQESQSNQWDEFVIIE